MGLWHIMRLRRKPTHGFTHSSALTGTSPNLGEELNSPSKVEGVARRAGGVCHTATQAHTRAHTVTAPQRTTTLWATPSATTT